TWLEELIGLACAGGEGLEIAKKVYANALSRFDELCGPYATVIDINKDKLPTPETVNSWDGEHFASVMRHDQSCTAYDLNVRQLLHVGYKVAAELGDEYLGALKKYEEIVAKNVGENIFDRHIKPIFLAD
ncbi:MAG: tagaturonate epimerase family protein, partial [Planctomycetota bacterium]